CVGDGRSFLVGQGFLFSGYLVNACCLFLTWSSRVGSSAVWVWLVISLLSVDASASLCASVMSFFSGLAVMVFSRFGWFLWILAGGFCGVLLCLLGLFRFRWFGVRFLMVFWGGVLSERGAEARCLEG
ncbi:hypothetical protein, partial [Neisseria sp. P0013.S004]|uniref:hypothetical protein n=1 Tax=Neisseria sp. P0013.S004 TaxID=3436740 RepID=UPI003F7F5F20